MDWIEGRRRGPVRSKIYDPLDSSSSLSYEASCRTTLWQFPRKLVKDSSRILKKGTNRFFWVARHHGTNEVSVSDVEGDAREME
eukprot:Gb_34392 [translate_table: standard]